MMSAGVESLEPLRLDIRWGANLDFFIPTSCRKPLGESPSPSYRRVNLKGCGYNDGQGSVGAPLRPLETHR